MYLCKEESLACSLWKKQKIAGLAGSRMSCKVCSETFEFYSIRFTTSVFYEGEDVLTEYYGIPRVLENEGEDIFFQEIYKWVRKDARVKKCFVRGYLDLLIGSLAMRGSKVDKDTGDFVGNTEEKALNHRAAKNNDQVDPRIYMVANYITQTSHIKNGIRTLKNQYFSL